MLIIINKEIEQIVDGNYKVTEKLQMFSGSHNKLKLVLHSDDEDEIRKFNEIAEEYK